MGENQTACQRELNRGMQALQARLKSLEDQVSALEETQLTDIGQTAAALAAAVTQIPQALPTYIANQLILKIASAALGMAAEDLQNFPGMGAAGDLIADISDMAEMVKALILELISTRILGDEFWAQFQMEMMLSMLTIPPYLANMIASALAAAESAIDAAQAALNADPGNADLQAALNAALTFRDNMEATAETVNRITECKIASQVLGL